MAWLDRAGGWKYLSACQWDAECIERGGEVLVHPATMAMRVKAWADGDSVTLTPQITGPLSAPVPTEYGWISIDMTTGTKWEIVELQPTKWHPYLDGFAAPGVKILRWAKASDVVFEGGKWYPKDILVETSTPDISWHVQSAFADASPQSPWVLGSLSFKHNTKRNNYANIGKCYTTGKIHHMPAPLVTGWNISGGFVGSVVGAYEVADGGIIRKAFNEAGIQTLINNGAVELATDATAGYTSVGASNYAFVVPWGRVVGPIVGTDKVAQSISWYCGNTADTGFELIFAGYTATALKATPTSLITGCEGRGLIPGSNQWMTVNTSAANLTNGQYIGICTQRFTGNTNRGFHGRYDNYGVGSDYLWDGSVFPGGSPQASAPATWPLLSKDPNAADFSAYLTYGDPPQASLIQNTVNIVALQRYNGG